VAGVYLADEVLDYRQRKEVLRSGYDGHLGSAVGEGARGTADLEGTAPHLFHFGPIVAHRLPDALGRTVECAVSPDQFARELRFVFRVRDLAYDLDFTVSSFGPLKGWLHSLLAKSSQNAARVDWSGA